jgi:hypothetical protein
MLVAKAVHLGLKRSATLLIAENWLIAAKLHASKQSSLKRKSAVLEVTL